MKLLHFSLISYDFFQKNKHIIRDIGKFYTLHKFCHFFIFTYGGFPITISNPSVTPNIHLGSNQSAKTNSKGRQFNRAWYVAVEKFVFLLFSIFVWISLNCAFRSSLSSGSTSKYSSRTCSSSFIRPRSSNREACLFSSKPIKVFAITNLKSRFGNG